jgi:hypothetical protein
MFTRTYRRALALVCTALVIGSRHRVCCRIPSWTAHVGQQWKPFDKAPWNLYNVWWRIGQRIAIRAEYDQLDV